MKVINLRKVRCFGHFQSTERKKTMLCSDNQSSVKLSAIDISCRVLLRLKYDFAVELKTYRNETNRQILESQIVAI